MDESAHVVLHTAPDGRALPTGRAPGLVLAFRDQANAESFARGLVEAGVPEAILAGLGDVTDLEDPERSPSDEITVFEDELQQLSEGECRERARRLALELGPSLLQRH
jgi:hypothetical protein